MLFENKELYLLFSTVIPFISFSNRTILAGTSRTILKGKHSHLLSDCNEHICNILLLYVKLATGLRQIFFNVLNKIVLITQP